jgi:hypothetical protein
MAGYTYLWEFIVKPGHADEFQRQYGPSGPWVALFRLAPGYSGRAQRVSRGILGWRDPSDLEVTL